MDATKCYSTLEWNDIMKAKELYAALSGCGYDVHLYKSRYHQHTCVAIKLRILTSLFGLGQDISEKMCFDVPNPSADTIDNDWIVYWPMMKLKDTEL